MLQYTVLLTIPSFPPHTHTHTRTAHTHVYSETSLHRCWTSSCLHSNWTSSNTGWVYSYHGYHMLTVMHLY